MTYQIFLIMDIEFFLPVEEFPTGGFAIWDGDAGAEVAFVAERVLVAEEFTQAGVVHRFRVVGLMLPGVQLGRISPGPAGTSRPVEHGDPALELLG